MKSVLVVYSGGLDSYTLLNKAMSAFEKVEAITFNYGQKHKIEIEYAKAACEKLGIAHEIVNLDLQKILAGSALVGDSDIPEGNYDKEKMKQTVVPNRNMVMISVAASLAIKMNSITYGTQHIQVIMKSIQTVGLSLLQKWLRFSQFAIIIRSILKHLFKIFQRLKLLKLA